MKIYQIELLEPKALSLLEELAKLNLIRVQEVQPPQAKFKGLLKKMREKNTQEELSLEEITKEVENVRKKRYEKRAKI